MATKWKNNRLFWWSAVCLAVGLAILLTILHSEPGNLRGDYFRTNSFTTQYSNYMDRLKLAVLGDFDQEKLNKRIVVTEDDINQHRYEYGDMPEQLQSIRDQYSPKIADAEDAGDKSLADMYRKERDEKLKDISLNFTSDEHVKKKIIVKRENQLADAMKQIRNIKETFPSDANGFEYFFQDTKTGKIYTSLNQKQQGDYKSYFSDKNMLFKEDFGVGNKALMYMENNPYYFGVSSEEEVTLEDETKVIQGYVGLPQNADPSSPLMAEYKQFKTIAVLYRVLAAAGLLLALAGLFGIVKSAFWHVEKGEVLNWFDRIPADIRLMVIWIALLSIMGPAGYWAAPGLNVDFIMHFGFKFLYYTAVVGFILLAVVQLIRCLIKKGFEQEWRDSFTYKFFNALKKTFLNLHLGVQLLLLLSIVFGMGMGFIIVFLYGNGSMDLVIFYFILCLLFGVPALYIIFRYVGNLNQIMRTVSGLAKGYQEDDLDVSGKSPLAVLAKDINTIKYGVKSSQSAQMKSERLKTELITNVSHDLRTPLTSIITYTDLLKSGHVSEEDREAYIEIIDRKSKRLKILIEDLFEASKMATGNIELEKRNVELVQMLQQTLAEHNDSIESSGLQFRVQTDEQPIHAVVDGQKLHRVFDNLIVNALKYSMPHTRVYISMLNKESSVEITFKNVSQFELGGNVDELFERFKRGDQSRHTEGSGLGLAIAKSIIDLHGGEMEIDVDGDMFKVTIVLYK
ncbi:sensor histidine kinase [Bacillus testis]|uniref:sensor histidine kinase n=1 Tax=Bacillus testis TaxID=1622072 RepID=UPI00067E92BD|nr:HAMP domain-containing sensor histidine kinase [Bacillus testis]